MSIIHSILNTKLSFWRNKSSSNGRNILWEMATTLEDSLSFVDYNIANIQFISTDEKLSIKKERNQAKTLPDTFREKNETTSKLEDSNKSVKNHEKGEERNENGIKDMISDEEIASSHKTNIKTPENKEKSPPTNFEDSSEIDQKSDSSNSSNSCLSSSKNTIWIQCPPRISHTLKWENLAVRRLLPRTTQSDADQC